MKYCVSIYQLKSHTCKKVLSRKETLLVNETNFNAQVQWNFWECLNYNFVLIFNEKAVLKGLLHDLETYLNLVPALLLIHTLILLATDVWLHYYCQHFRLKKEIN